EPVAFGLQLFAKLQVVFDDAVVDDGDFARIVRVGMRVDVRRFAVGRPAGVADADGPLERGPLQTRLEDGNTAFAFGDKQLPVLRADGDARRIIPPVFQFSQTVQQNLLGIPVPDVSDNSAHGASSRDGKLGSKLGCVHAQWLNIPLESCSAGRPRRFPFQLAARMSLPGGPRRKLRTPPPRQLGCANRAAFPMLRRWQARMGKPGTNPA